MTLKEHIDDIREKLEKGRYPNEAAVSQGIVLRLLDVLAWPTYDIQVVIPEYGVEATRVDFALCHPPSKPIVFIEVKQVGKIEGAERQLFEYAFHAGVRIAILTDGQTWRFFHPMGQGDYRERKVHELDFIEGDSEESAKRLNRYLNYESIRTGEVVKAIEEDYRNLSRQRQVEAGLPEAWGKLVEEADEFLLDVVAEKTDSLCGHKPTNEQVLDFLKSLERKTESDLGVAASSSIPSGRPTQPRGHRQRASRTRLVVTMPNGERINHNVAAATFVEAIEKLGIERVRGLNKKDIIPLISTSEDDRYRQRQSGRYYIATHSHTKKKKAILEEIASDLGEPLTVEIVRKD